MGTSLLHVYTLIKMECNLGSIWILILLVIGEIVLKVWYAHTVSPTIHECRMASAKWTRVSVVLGSPCTWTLPLETRLPWWWLSLREDPSVSPLTLVTSPLISILMESTMNQRVVSVVGWYLILRFCFYAFSVNSIVTISHAVADPGKRKGGSKRTSMQHDIFGGLRPLLVTHCAVRIGKSHSQPGEVPY